jgi:hypothetical protein
MALKTIVRGRFGTGQLTCGEFDKDVESVHLSEIFKARNPLHSKGLQAVCRYGQNESYKPVNGGKLVSNRDCFGHIFYPI